MMDIISSSFREKRDHTSTLNHINELERGVKFIEGHFYYNPNDDNLYIYSGDRLVKVNPL